MMKEPHSTRGAGSSLGSELGFTNAVPLPDTYFSHSVGGQAAGDSAQARPHWPLAATACLGRTSKWSWPLGAHVGWAEVTGPQSRCQDGVGGGRGGGGRPGESGLLNFVSKIMGSVSCQPYQTLGASKKARPLCSLGDFETHPNDTACHHTSR